MFLPCWVGLASRPSGILGGVHLGPCQRTHVETERRAGGLPRFSRSTFFNMRHDPFLT